MKLSNFFKIFKPMIERPNGESNQSGRPKKPVDQSNSVESDLAEWLETWPYLTSEAVAWAAPTIKASGFDGTAERTLAKAGRPASSAQRVRWKLRGNALAGEYLSLLTEEASASGLKAREILSAFVAYPMRRHNIRAQRQRGLRTTGAVPYALGCPPTQDCNTCEPLIGRIWQFGKHPDFKAKDCPNLRCSFSVRGITKNEKERID